MVRDTDTVWKCPHCSRKIYARDVAAYGGDCPHCRGNVTLIKG